MLAQNQKSSQKVISGTLKSRKEKPVVIKPEPLKILLDWKSPSRVFRKLNREYLTTIGAIVFLIAVILIFLKEWFLIAVIIALGFFSYILSTTKPEEIEHKITNRGLVTGGRNYPWGQLIRFWFEEKWGQKILCVDGVDRLPFRLILLLGEKKEEELKKILSDYLPEEKPEKTWADKAGEWISRQVPLEK